MRFWGVVCSWWEGNVEGNVEGDVAGDVEGDVGGEVVEGGGGGGGGIWASATRATMSSAWVAEDCCKGEQVKIIVFFLRVGYFCQLGIIYYM